MSIRRGFHYRGFHIRFGAYRTHMSVHGWDRRAFAVTVTRRGGYKHRYTSSNKRYCVERIKQDIDQSFFPNRHG